MEQFEKCSANIVKIHKNIKTGKDYVIPYICQKKFLMNISIRKGKKSDLPQVLMLIKELALYEKAPEEVTLTITDFERDFKAEHPLFNFFVAESKSAEKSKKGSIAGIALYYYGYSTWKGKRMYLDDIVVTEKLRGKGIGKLLFDKIVNEAKKNKVKQIMWQVLEWNKPAINFYKKYNSILDPEWITGKLNEEQLMNANC